MGPCPQKLSTGTTLTWVTVTRSLLLFGLAALLDWALDTRVARVAWALGVGLIAWNALFVVQYRLGFISMSGPYTLGQLTLGKLEMLTELWRRVAQRMAR